MQKQSRPETLGVFSPVNHVVISFPTVQDMEGAAGALAGQGFRAAEIIRYTPEQMKAQAEADLAGASPLAELGQEVNLVRAHRDLADQGYSFLIVHAPERDKAAAVATVARGFHAERAQKYGSFMIEELIAPPGDDAQAFESPSRGLD